MPHTMVDLLRTLQFKIEATISAPQAGAPRRPTAAASLQACWQITALHLVVPRGPLPQPPGRQAIAADRSGARVLPRAAACMPPSLPFPPPPPVLQRWSSWRTRRIGAL